MYPVENLSDSPFILDMGATCHISPVRLDFKTLHQIAPYPITSVGGDKVYATGISSIELCIASSHKVVIDDTLYVLSLTIHLISVFCLNCSRQYISSFDSDSCCVTNKAGAVILRETVLESCCLYGLTLSSLCTGHSQPIPAPSAAHYASHTLDLKTWHWCLGHCNTNAIVNMACKNMV